MKCHKENITDYINLGGDPKIAKQLSIESLPNKSRLSYLLTKLKPKKDLPEVFKSEPEPEPEPEIVSMEADRKTIFKDLLCQYPEELHSSYKKRYEAWLEACSLKIQLNNIDDKNVDGAIVLQKKILQCFDLMDKYQKALDHFNQNQRILIVETEKDFSNFSQSEIVLKRNNIRTNISKRKQTIKKQKENLPPENSPDFIHKLNKINQKIEELQELENQENKLNDLINNK
jgi:hypothetical protein